MASKEEIEAFKKKYEQHKKTPEGMKAQKRKAAYQKKMMSPQAMSFDSEGKMTGIHHHRAKKKKK